MPAWKNPHTKHQPSVLQGILPVDRSRLSADLLAGITLAALSIPEVMGYTRIAETPVITGLYTLLLPLLLYALFGSSRHLVVGADSATAAILASGITGLAAPRSAEWLALAGLLALMAAAFLLLARLARLGFLADFLSRTVLVGFLTGVGIQVAIAAVPGMLGLVGDHTTLHALTTVMRGLGRIHLPSVAVAVGVLAVIAGARWWSSRLPGALLAVVLAIVASRWLHLADHGVAVLGPVPGGLPTLGLPAMPLTLDLVERLVPTAFAMFVVIVAQSAATARAYAIRYNEPFDENVDLVGLCLANVGAGLGGTFVVNGSPTKSQIVESAGGFSQLAQLTAGAVVLLVLLFFTGPLADLPEAALAAVVFRIGLELVDLRGMRQIYVERPWEFWVALITAATVVLVGVMQSVLLAVFLSLAVHTRHGYLVNNMLLVPDAAAGWRQQPVRSRGQMLPGLMIYRFMHNMYYANCQVLHDEVVELVRDASPPLRWFCIDATAVNDVDYTAAETLRRLHRRLAKQGVRLLVCQVTDEVRREFDRSGLTELIGREAIFATPVAVMAAYSLRSADDDRGGTDEIP